MRTFALQNLRALAGALVAVLLLSVSVVAIASRSDRRAAQPHARAAAAVQGPSAARRETSAARPSPAAATSRRAHRALSSREAIAVARRLKTGPLTGALWTPVELAPGERIARYLGDHAAQVTRAGSDRGALMRSTHPLRAADAAGRLRPVDLRLRAAVGGLRSANPLVGVRFSRDARRGARFEDVDVTVAPVGVRASRAVAVRDRAFYANAQEDTDWVIEPAAEGIQTYAILRSPGSPEKLGLRFGGGDRAAIRAARGPLGGYEVARGDDVLARVGPPRAWDADGRPVDVSARLDGSVLEMRAEHRDAAVRYPVTVDPPVVEDYRHWKTDATVDFTGWRFATSDAAKYQNLAGSSYMGRGLYVYTRASYTYSPADWGQWVFDARGYGDAFVYRGEFHRLHHDNYHVATSLFTGIYDRGKTGGVADPTNAAGWQGNSPLKVTANFYDSTANTKPHVHCVNAAVCSTLTAAHGITTARSNVALFGNRPEATGLSSNFTDFTGGAVMFQSDDVLPFVSSDTVPDQWLRDAPTDLSATVSDTGLGMHRATVALNPRRSWTHTANQPASEEKSVTASCTDTASGPSGTRKNPCPRDIPISFKTGTVVEGANQFDVTGLDVLGDVKTTPLHVKIDRTPPILGVPTGTLWDARNQVYDHRFESLFNPSYATRLTATDGSDASNATKRSGVKAIDFEIVNSAGTVVQSSPDPQPQACPQGSCSKPRDFVLNTDSLADGDYTVRATAVDQLDHRSAPVTWPITIDRRGTIHRVEQLDGEPGNGGVKLADEIAQLGTYNGRRTDEEEIATRRAAACPTDGTRQCGDVRYRVTSDDTDDEEDRGADSYARYVGTTVNDERLDVVTDAQSAVERAVGTPARSGPLVDILALGQTPPPGHGVTYDVYETDEPENVDDTDSRTVHRTWVDRTTRLPLREQTLIEGDTESDVFYTYNRQRLETSQVAGDTFAVAKPENPPNDHYEDWGEGGPEQPGDDPQADSYEQRAATARRFRAEFGLAATEGVVQATMADPTLNASSYQFGAPLTAVEQQEILLRDRITDALDIVDNYGFDRGAGTYAGTYIDQAAGGLVYVGFTSLSDVHLLELKKLFPYPDRLRSFNATATMLQLDALQARVTADIPVLVQQGFNVGRVSEVVSRNRVEVAVPEPTLDLSLKLAARYPGENVTLVQGEPSPVPVTENHLDWPGSSDRINRRVPPLYAGLAIYRRVSATRSSTCSSAFSVRRRNAYRVLTAGHCGPKNSKFLHHRRALGPMVRKAHRDGGCCDSALIRVKPRMATNRVYLGGGRTLRIRRIAPFASGEERDRQHEGTRLNLVGYRFGRPQPGRLLDHDMTTRQCQDRNHNDDCDPGEPVWEFPHQHRASYRSAGGMSGGAVYNPGNREAWGNHHTADSSFTPIETSLTRFGFRVVGTTPVVRVLDSTGANPRPETDDARFTIELDYVFHQAVRVDFTTADSPPERARDAPATAGQDYTARSGSVTIPAGTRRMEVVVDVLDDALPEGRESFELRITRTSDGRLATDREGIAVIDASDPPAR